MAQYAAELFVQCVYSLELSYHDLIEAEAALKRSLTEIFEANQGEFIHFEEISDTMRSQCVFPVYTEDLFHAISDSVAPFMDGRVECRMLFVSKDLDALHVVTISEGKWQESSVHMPAAGPLTKILREQKP